MAVDVTGVAAPADDLSAAVADACLVVHVQAAGGHRAFDERADEMHRQEAAAELNHLGPRDRRLEPLSMVELRVPPVDGRVVPAEGDLEHVALIEAQDHPLDLGVEAGCGRRIGTGVRSRRKADLAEERHPR